MSTAQQAPLQHKQTSDLKAILKLTGPILLTQLAQVGMGTIDTVMSGYVSTRDLAAVAIGSAVWTPIWLFLAGVLVALSPAIAKARSGLASSPAIQALLCRFEVVGFGQGFHAHHGRNDNSIRSGICQALVYADTSGAVRWPYGCKYRQERDRAKPDCGG